MTSIFERITPLILHKKIPFWLEFLLAMTEKEIKARYKHTFLGFLWIILNPLFQMIVIGFVFQFFIPVQVDNYFIYLFSGLLPWNVFSYSLNKATPSIVYERTLIQKAKFPREAIVLSIILSNIFHFTISLALFLAFIILISAVELIQSNDVTMFYIFTNSIYHFSKWLLLIPLTVWLLSFTAGMGLLTASQNVRYRDTSFVVNALMPLWFYATPVIYTLDLLPVKLQIFSYLNPMTSIIELYQWILVDTEITSIFGIAISLIITMICFYIGLQTFVKQSPYFDDWL